MKKVLVTRKIDDQALNRLKRKFDVTVNEADKDYTYSELKEIVNSYDGIITTLTNQVDAELLRHCSRPKIFANCAVGYNNMDIKAAKENGIVLTNTPDVLTDTTADMAMGLMLACARRIVESDRYIRSGQFKGWKPDLLFGKEISNQNIGIIGAGRIGQAFAKRAKAFNMNIFYYNRSKKQKFEDEVGAKQVSLEKLLQISDYISIHVPLTSETHHMIGKRELDLMKHDAILINTARGAVINEDVLAYALENNQIGGAGLDVFENEPDVHPKLLELDQVVMTPHLGSATTITRRRMANVAVDNVINVLNGKEPITPIR